MGFPRHLLLLIFLVPFVDCFNLNSTHCVKSSTNQIKVRNARSIVIVLARLTPITGFYKFTYGSGANAVHGLYWCGRNNTVDCPNCLNETIKNIRTKCRRCVAARSWFSDFCYLRFDTDNFLGMLDTHLVNVHYSTKKIMAVPMNLSAFHNELHNFFNDLRSSATTVHGFFANATVFSAAVNMTVYGEAQCTQDLTPEVCMSCLATLPAIFDKQCMDRRSCEVLLGSCFMGYYT